MLERKAVGRVPRMSRWAAVPALAFGLLLTLAEVARNWDNWQWWPFWLVDFVAAALLIAGALLAIRDHCKAPQVLAGAWGFTSAMFYMSFWSHIEQFDQPADGNLAQTPLTVVIGVLWAATVIAFVHSLLAARRPTVEHG